MEEWIVLRKPDKETLSRVLQLAHSMRDSDRDRYDLARVLLYLEERNRALEDVLQRAEYYVRFGMGDHELTELRQVIQKLREEEQRQSQDSSMLV
jgi:hypothetical protein